MMVADSGSMMAADSGSMVEPAAPSLLAILPSKGAAAVRLDPTLVLQFSSAIAPTSLVVTITPNVALGAPVFNTDNTEAQFGPLMLQAGTQYSITVSAADGQGRAVTGERSSSFTTLAQVDSTPPTLVASTPMTGGMNVAVSSALALTFSEAMDVSSLTLTLEPSKALMEAVWSAGDTVASIAAPTLDGKTDYTLSYSASDRAGNPVSGSITFSTATPPDTDAPTIVSSAPAANAMAVPTNAVLSISFSEAMNKATVDAAFSISPAVPGTALWDGTDTLRTFQPSAPLSPSTQYTVTVGVGGRDRGGNALAAPFSFTFTTAAAPDTTRPTVVSTVPAAGAMGVARNTTLSVTFSEPMDKASVQVAFVVNVPMSQNGGTFAWSADGRTVTYTPPARFAYAANVAFRIGLGSKDLAGNALVANVDRGFIVRREGVLIVDSIAAFDGHVSNAGLVTTGSSNLIVGDNSANLAFRSFLGFDVSALPESTLAITEAYLYVQLSGVAGNPLGTLAGEVQLEHVAVGPTLLSSAYGAMRVDNTTSVFGWGQLTHTGWRLALVADAVREDRAASRSGRSQFRLRFPNELSPNGTADNFAYLSGNTSLTTCTRTNPRASGASCKPHLIVVYEYP